MSQQEKWGSHHFPRCFFLFCHTHLLPAVPAHTSTSDGGSSSPGHRVRTLESNITNVIYVLSQLSPRPVEPGQGCPEPGQETSPHLGNISITWSFPSLWLLFALFLSFHWSLSPFVDLQESSSGCLRTRCCSPDTPKTSPSSATGCLRRASRRRCGGRTWPRPTSSKATGGLQGCRGSPTPTLGSRLHACVPV